jgi:hypothetical protein
LGSHESGGDTTLKPEKLLSSAGECYLQCWKIRRRKEGGSRNREERKKKIERKVK